MSPLLLALSLLHRQEPAIFADETRPPHERAADLITRMTLEEKIGQMMHEAPAIPRLGIKKYNWWSEALHGVARDNVTVFPQAIGNAATFDAPLFQRMATAISDEARAQYNINRAKNTDTDLGLDFWAPNINIFRDPRWGRGQETYGEDPYLTGRMVVNFVHGMQGNDPLHLKTISTPKHFAVHSGPDPLRHQFDAKVSQHDMWLTYLPAFEAAIVEGGAWSTMSSYNRLNGFPNSANVWLLQKTLRERWHFPGYVVSDCGAIDDILYGHHYAKSKAEAAADAVKAGCDLECGSSYTGLKQAVTEGLITEDQIDTSLTRLMEARFRLGMFDKSTRYDNIGPEAIDSANHRAIARKLAQESMVLLKNQGNLLPLSPSKLKTVAVIGPNATSLAALYGNYNGTNRHMVTPLEGIRKALPGAKVLYTKGCALDGRTNLVPLHFTSLQAEYFDNQTLDGEGHSFQSGKTIELDSGDGSLMQGGPTHDYSIRWTGTFAAPKTGKYTLSQTCDDGMRVWVDGKQLLSDWRIGAPRTTQVEIKLVKGESHDVKVEFYQAGGGAVARLNLGLPESSKFEEATSVAKKADVVIVVAGIDGNIESEEGDRSSIELPEVQQAMIKQLATLGKPIVLVYENGGPITFGWAKRHIPAILEAWYPGEEGGNALADILFGKVSPSGHLPVTVFKSLKDLPAFDDYRNAGHSYRFSTKQPEWPFGYGLSYSKVAVSAKVPRSLKLGKSLQIPVQVRNLGHRQVDSLVQVYVRHIHPSQPMPLKELKAFGRVSVSPGHPAKTTLSIRPRDLAVLRSDTHLWLEPHTVEIFVGDHQPMPNEKGWVKVHLAGKMQLIP